MIRINQMKLNIEHTSDDFERKILKTLCIKKEELQGFQIRKQSIDARKKPVLYSFTVCHLSDDISFAAAVPAR